MKLYKIGLIFLLILFVSIPLKSQSYWDTDIVCVEKSPRILKKLHTRGLDILMVQKDRIYVLCSINEMQFLQKERIPFTIETANFYSFKRNELSVQGGLNGDYHSYLEIEEELWALENNYPQIAKVFDIGDSLENRNIYALKISDNVAVDETEAKVFFSGCHHAREWISVEVSFLIGKYLVENYENDLSIQTLVDNCEIWIVPIVNPDGLEYSIHVYRYWRKNRRDNGDGTYGVDLNRNYGYEWGLDNKGSSPNPNSGVYRGPESFSEPESRAVRDLFLQKNFQAMISFHNYSQVVLYPWGYTALPSDKDALMDGMAAQMSQLMENVKGTVYEYGQSGDDFYLTNGDTTDWTFGIFGIPSFTIELPPVDVHQGGFFNGEEEIIPIFEENLPAAFYLIEWSIQNYVPSDNPRKATRKIPLRSRNFKKKVKSKK